MSQRLWQNYHQEPVHIINKAQHLLFVLHDGYKNTDIGVNPDPTLNAHSSTFPGRLMVAQPWRYVDLQKIVTNQLH